MAEPAPVILGSALLMAELARHGSSRRAATGCPSIDAALEGGILYGDITSIAGSEDDCKSLIVLHFIAAHLLYCTSEEVAFIDTSGSFSPIRLRDVIVDHLQIRDEHPKLDHSGYVYRRASPTKHAKSREQLEQEAAYLLDRVRLMRVFDLSGVIEAVSEVAKQWRLREREAADAREAVILKTGAETEIPNSDDEGDLLDEEPEPLSNLATSQLCGGITMIVVDNIANVVNAAVTQNHISGQAMLATFFRSLKLLTVRHKICTIFVNSVVGASNSNLTNSNRMMNDLSIFASNIAKPALGKAYAYSIDMSLLLSTLPENSSDTGLTQNDGNEEGCNRSAKVLEVLKDRSDQRAERWAAFMVGGGVRLLRFR